LARKDALVREGGQGEIHTFIRLGQCRGTSMAIVVALADRLSQAHGHKDRKPVEAQILLFTGVRYERLGEGAKPSVGRRATRTKK
jgi:hypothetical protein